MRFVVIFYMHVYFLAAYFAIGAHLSLPLLGLLAAVIFIGEIFFLNRLQKFVNLCGAQNISKSVVIRPLVLD